MNVNYEKLRLILNLVNAVLLSVGLWKMFPKCGIDKKWALVPYGRFYKLAQCADREEDGIAVIVLMALSSLLRTGYGILEQAGEEYERTAYILSVVVLALLVIVLIYHIRIYSGLCTVFGQKKGWVLLWFIADYIPAIWWGWSKNIQPINGKFQKAPAIYGKKEAENPEGLVIDIEKRTVGFLFHKRTLIRDFHLTVHPGRMVLLLGGSGSGKTVFVNAVTGYEKAKARILLNGENVYKSFDSMKYEIGFVPQQDTMRNHDTVYRTVADMALLRLPDSVGKKEREQKIDSVLDTFGLHRAKHRQVGKQSGGQKRRISISMEYIADPYLFVLDEPDSGLDGILARSLMQHLHDISREGKIVIVITHTPDRVIDLFDDVIVLAKDSANTGRLAYYGPVEEAKAFFGKQSMEGIIQSINRKEEGGEGKADELITRFEEVRG